MQGKLPNLEIEYDQDYRINLLYDDCKSGESEYGKWYLYSIKTAAGVMRLFAEPPLHELLKDYRRGDNLTIRRTSAGNKDVWEVKRSTNGVAASPAQAGMFDDRTRDIHRQVALKIATQSMGPASKGWTEYEKLEIQSRMSALLEILECEQENGQ